MRKALWFLIAILLCFASAAEALKCNNCREFKIGTGCLTENPPVPCTATRGQKCEIVKSFLDGTIKGIVKLGCTKSIECGLTVFNKTVGSVETTCCDDRDFCNKP